MKPLKALVVEDDAQLGLLLVTTLEASGFEVELTRAGLDAVQRVRQDQPDLITLDLHLPDIDGFEVCRRVRDETSAYIVVVSGRSDEVDKLLGLELGADDYLTKPFSVRELSARVAAMFRRPRVASASEPAGPPEAVGAAGPAGSAPADDDDRRAHGPLTVDLRAREVAVDGTEVNLTRTEFDLLTTLLSDTRKVWSREELLATVWGDTWGRDTHLVEVHVGNLRRKLGGVAGQGPLVRTVRGVGYRLAG
ncbi:MAG: response regulator transcription factor [Actinomycetes bacterium]